MSKKENNKENNKVEQGNNKKVVDINLELNEADNTVMSDLHKNMLKEELENLPPLKMGEVSINGIYAYKMGDELEVNIYIRNGLPKQISIDSVPVVITNKKGDILAREVFDMKELGIIPSLGGRPYKIYFNKENVFVDNIPKDDWEVKFENEIKVVKTVDVELEELPEGVPSEILKEIKDFMKNLSLIKSGDISISTIKISEDKHESISIMLLIRNGLDKQIKLDKLPINIEDEKGDFVGGGIFEIENIVVNPHKARVYNFNLKAEKIVNKDADLSKCTVFFNK